MKAEYKKLIRNGWSMYQYKDHREYHPPGTYTTSDILTMMADIDHQLYFVVGNSGLDEFLQEYEND